ncbi:MAG: hypothetical protein IH991_08370 [Planctomycetes bacterium]|nr:hypothetical protein [Planctomycetota bacterium]
MGNRIGPESGGPQPQQLEPISLLGDERTSVGDVELVVRPSVRLRAAVAHAWRATGLTKSAFGVSNDSSTEAMIEQVECRRFQ